MLALLAAAALSPPLKAEVTRAVEAQLVDPGSAQFKLGPVKSTDRYCGFVNAKNRMGGYNGFEPFLVHFNPDGSVKIVVFPGTFDPGLVNEARQAILTACAEGGY